MRFPGDSYEGPIEEALAAFKKADRPILILVGLSFNDLVVCWDPPDSPLSAIVTR